jgi:hypothetical protein
MVATASLRLSPYSCSFSASYSCNVATSTTDLITDVRVHTNTHTELYSRITIKNLAVSLWATSLNVKEFCIPLNRVFICYVHISEVFLYGTK